MRNSQYWQKRFEYVEAQQLNKGIEYYNNLSRQYEKAAANITKEIEAWYTRFATEEGISLADAKKLLNSGELKAFRMSVEEYIDKGRTLNYSDQWAKELERASTKWHVSRLEALKLQMQQQVESLMGYEVDGLEKVIKDIYTDGYYRSAFEIQKGIGIGWDLMTLDENKVKKLIAKPWAPDGSNFSQRVWGNHRPELINYLNTELTQNLIRGDDPQRLINRVAKKFNTSKAKAGNLIMTESAFFASASQKDCFNDLDVERYEIVATLDSHTSEICQELDGKVFKMSEYDVGVTAPPFHCRCRSCTAPYFDDEFANDIRAARDKDGKYTTVPADMKYPEWKEKFVDGGSKNSLEKLSESNKILSIDDCLDINQVESLFREQDWFIHGTGALEGWRSDEGLSLSGCDLKCAKEVYKSYEQFFNRYPQMVGKLAAPAASKLDWLEYAQCNFGFGSGFIQVNTTHYNNAEKIARRYASDVEQGFHVVGTDWTAIVTHELGHALDDYLTYSLHLAGYNGKKPKIVSAMMRPKVLKKTGFKVGDMGKEVSDYATKTSQEWFAECFAEYMKSKEPRKVAAEFGKQLEEIMKEVK